jgi:hypothetical protein
MKIKNLVAAIALAAVTGASNATIIQGDAATDGEFFLTVLDKAGQKSYGLDLGFTVSQMNADINAGRSFDLSTDANFAGFLGNTNLSWTVTGVNTVFDRRETKNFGFSYTSISSMTQMLAAAPIKAEMNGAMNNITNMARNSNASTGIPYNGTNGGDNLSNVALIGEFGYAGDISWGATMGNRGIVVADVIDNAMTMYRTRLTVNDSNVAVVDTLGTWLLTSTGQLTYSAPSAVPVPAAVWLFGSGLVGLVGIARRKRA